MKIAKSIIRIFAGGQHEQLEPVTWVYRWRDANGDRWQMSQALKDLMTRYYYEN